MVTLAASQSLALSLPAFVVLGIVALLAMGAVGFLIGLLGAPLHLLFAKARASTALAFHLTLSGFLLCGYYLWQAAWTIHLDDRTPAALAMAAMPLGFTGVVYFNARFMLRRLEIGKPLGLPWLPSAFGAGLALVLLSGAFQVFRDTGGPHALEDDRNVVFVTVSERSAFGEPVVAALAEGVVFSDAVTPAPATRPAAASLLTGLHPLRHRVLFDDGVLGWQYPTLAEALVEEGYATGAFVSDSSVRSSSGLEQGFRVYDDDFSPVVPGLLRLNLARNLLGRGHWTRSATDTTDRFVAWLDTKIDYPFFAWVQLPAEGSDEALVAILDALEPVADETFVVLTATQGTPTRSGGVLYDDRVRIPLLVRLPGIERKRTIVEQQVRLVDLATTSTTWLGIKARENEGLDLASFITGRSNRSIGVTLIGRTDDGQIQLGLRNNGVKFISDAGGQGGELYQVTEDPEEQHDLSAEQAEALKRAEAILAGDSVRLEKLLE